MMGHELQQIHLRAGRWLQRLSQKPWVDALLGALLEIVLASLTALSWLVTALVVFFVFMMPVLPLYFLGFTATEMVQVAVVLFMMFACSPTTIEVVDGLGLQGWSRWIAVIFLSPFVATGWTLIGILVVLSPILLFIVLYFLPLIVLYFLGFPTTEMGYRGRYFGG